MVISSREIPAPYCGSCRLEGGECPSAPSPLPSSPFRRARTRMQREGGEGGGGGEGREGEGGRERQRERRGRGGRGVKGVRHACVRTPHTFCCTVLTGLGGSRRNTFLHLPTLAPATARSPFNGRSLLFFCGAASRMSYNSKSVTCGKAGAQKEKNEKQKKTYQATCGEVGGGGRKTRTYEWLSGVRWFLWRLHPSTIRTHSCTASETCVDPFQKYFYFIQLVFSFNSF